MNDGPHYGSYYDPKSKVEKQPLDADYSIWDSSSDINNDNMDQFKYNVDYSEYDSDTALLMILTFYHQLTNNGDFHKPRTLKILVINCQIKKTKKSLSLV